MFESLARLFDSFRNKPGPTRHKTLTEAYADPHAFILRDGRLSRLESPERDPGGEIVQITPALHLEILCPDWPAQGYTGVYQRLDVCFKMLEEPSANDAPYRGAPHVDHVRLEDAQAYLDWQRGLDKRSTWSASNKHPARRRQQLVHFLHESAERVDLPFTVTLL